jgi:mono/diheme cytochrome c family protein
MKFSALLLLILLSGCTKKGDSPQEPLSGEQLVARGKSIYALNCIACHAVNPAKDGAMGPAVFGSSMELLEARIMRGAYPEGYKPKRTTRQMAAITHLEKELGALHAFLNAQ